LAEKVSSEGGKTVDDLCKKFRDNDGDQRKKTRNRTAKTSLRIAKTDVDVGGGGVKQREIRSRT